MTTPDQKRALAQAARRERAARLRRLRRRVAATALSTLALAIGVVAYDGSMGTTTATPAVTATVAQDGSAAATATGDDAITTRQS
jgi:hypothetical protein